jgi:hypothetical protein
VDVLVRAGILASPIIPIERIFAESQTRALSFQVVFDQKSQKRRLGTDPSVVAPILLSRTTLHKM